MRARSRSPFLPWAIALALCACTRTDSPPAAPAASRPAASGTPTAAGADLLRDDRIARWMGDCARKEPFLEDTSDAIGILVSKLAAGQVEPLHLAREELAQYGARAIPELQRLFDACYGSQFLGQRVQNVVEVLGLMRTDEGRGMILASLRHPQETVRKAAARALVDHARPEDFDALLEFMPLSGPESQGDFALALEACDRARLERQLCAWIEEGGARSLIDLLSVRLCDTRDREVLARWKSLLAKLDGKARVFLEAGLAAGSDEAALAEMRAWLLDRGNPARRQLVAQALAKVGLARELQPLLTKADPDEALRTAAVQAIAAAPLVDETRGILRAALADASDAVRDVALQALVDGRDAGAIDAAVELLLGARADHERGMKVLQAALARDPALCERVLATLTLLFKGETGSGLVDENTLARSIGQVPLARAAEFVMSLCSRESPPVQGQRAHRWYAEAAGNTGSAGMAYLRERWRSEDDPARRMDLVTAGTFERSESARAFLVEALESERATPPEILLAADRLAHLGPLEVVAPILKRAALRMNDKVVRPAFNCLLWTWYARSR